jgi:ubiquinone/menaquinone biosynthesis C-methylase UbiE
MAKEYLKPAIGGTIVDASCGSGLFSRLFVKSGLFSQVIALDFSENMLRQCSEFVENENIPNEYTLTALLFVNFVYSVLLCF